MNHIRKALIAITLTSTLANVSYAENSEMTFNSEKTTSAHLVKTQFYRWYQLYERPINDARTANQLDILDENIVITTTAGQQKDKAGYPERLTAYEGWKNAHHVQSVQVVEQNDNTYKLTANIEYQNILPSGEKNSYNIDYDTSLVNTASLLPNFTEVTITPTGQSNLDFEDAYPSNRMLSLVHYWAALMEQLDGDVEPFKELLTPDFTLNFSSSSNSIDSIEKLSTWLNGAPLQLKQSSHHLENFSVTAIGENQYQVKVDFDWFGITKTDQKMVAKTRHTWEVIDNENERFARVKTVNVEALEAFRMVK